MLDQQFISYSQNAEDVVLWRALRGVSAGRYVDVGANDPTVDSVTKVFADAGWSGICVEPLPDLAERLRAARPTATVFEGVAGNESGVEIILHAVPGTGLSSVVAGVAAAPDGAAVVDMNVASVRLDDLLERQSWEGEQIHLVTVDVEGAEAEVLAGLDLKRWRPWVLVVEATRPNSTEQSHHAWEADVLAAGYSFCLFDGLSRYYVSDEHVTDIGPSLSYPACTHDHYVTHREVETTTERDELLRQVVHWRTTAFGTWASAVQDTRQRGVEAQYLLQARARIRSLRKRVQRLRGKLDDAERRIAEMERSTSWRVTGPLRGASQSARRAARRGR